MSIGIFGLKIGMSCGSLGLRRNMPSSTSLKSRGLDLPLLDVFIQAVESLAGGDGGAGQEGRRPLQMRLVTLGHVVWTVVWRYAAELRTCEAIRLPASKISTVRSGKARFQLLTRQLIGNAVIMPVDLDVIIDRGPDRFPVRHHVTLGRQRLKRRPVQAGDTAKHDCLPVCGTDDGSVVPVAARSHH